MQINTDLKMCSFLENFQSHWRKTKTHTILSFLILFYLTFENTFILEFSTETFKPFIDIQHICCDLY